MTLRPAARAAFGAALLALAAPAAATPVQVTGQIANKPFGTDASEKAVVSLRGDTIQTYAGRFALTGTEGFGDFYAFCVDLETALKINGKGSAYTPGALPFTPIASESLRRLYTSGYGAIDPNDGATTAGFQLAVWEVVYDSNDQFAYDLGADAFQVVKASDEAFAFADTLLGGLKTASSGGYDLTFLGSGLKTNGKRISQSLVTGTPAAIPLPAAAWMLGAGLIALGLAGGFARRPRRSDAAAG